MKKFVLSIVLLCIAIGAGAQNPVYSNELVGKAESGDTQAMCDLGKCYDYGNGIEQNYYKAVAWYRKAADLGNAMAMNRLGFCYEFGNGVEQDDAKAFEWHQKSAELGNATAMLVLGYYYNNKGAAQNRAKAEEWFQKAINGFRKAAESGDAGAMINIGYCYEYGNGVKRDFTKAFKWWKRAADLGNAKAMTNVGNCYFWGAGVDRDHDKAIEWYRKGAEHGDDNAMYNLGNYYCWGAGIEKDYLKAAEWYQKAAESGNADAMYQMGVFNYQGYGMEQNYAKAVEWYQKAVIYGNDKAIESLANCYAAGTGIEKNQKKADLLFAAEKAAQAGESKKSVSLIGEALELYSFFEKDYVREKIIAWEKRGVSEIYSEWQKRVNERTTNDKIEELIGKAKKAYIAKYSPSVKFNFSLKEYDSVREAWMLTDPRFGDIMLHVPAGNASQFEQSWNEVKIISPTYLIADDHLALATLSFVMPDGKIYKYTNEALLP